MMAVVARPRRRNPSSLSGARHVVARRRTYCIESLLISVSIRRPSFSLSLSLSRCLIDGSNTLLYWFAVDHHRHPHRQIL